MHAGTKPRGEPAIRCLHGVPPHVLVPCRPAGIAGMFHTNPVPHGPLFRYRQRPFMTFTRSRSTGNRNDHGVPIAVMWTTRGKSVRTHNDHPTNGWLPARFCRFSRTPTPLIEGVRGGAAPARGSSPRLITKTARRADPKTLHSLQTLLPRPALRL